MSSSRPARFVAMAGFAVLTLAVGACGSDDDSSDATTAPAATEAAATTEAPAIEEATTFPPATEVEATEPMATEPMATEPADTEAPPETDAMVMLEGDLVGTFSIDPAECADGAATSGSYFRMVQLGGTPEAGPFIPNGDSACGDPTYSGLTAGVDGGLQTGNVQAAPDPAFDEAGNGLADGIFQPVMFFAVAFAGAMDATGAAPAITATDGVLTGDLSAFTAYYGAASFNQGAPKPDGSGAAPAGTIDPMTGAYVLEWTSLIVGGSFDGFTGVWHLEGTFTPAEMAG